ncbi:hypothetical protein HBH98_223420 [Parastagonospora nodorum]|nr:hypothetical protein HBH52_232490 [Parastagonospora nodorum]KAH4181796.1 hypothetical protein HBH42_230920 [Parastagonospora nodorum]KAH4337401.1 hypothetical protein HBH98_223420 [Parastagonospora nodorum]KAH4359230.1 hypothetical protein HBH97_212720 [Parastagonospora nodorum]KAH4373597.1 hypothetical protein HBH99_224890 [Parastagonospora nodorum]
MLSVCEQLRHILLYVLVRATLQPHNSITIDPQKARMQFPVGQSLDARKHHWKNAISQSTIDRRLHDAHISFIGLLPRRPANSKIGIRLVRSINFNKSTWTLHIGEQATLVNMSAVDKC